MLATQLATRPFIPPLVKDWARERELTALCTSMMLAAQGRRYQPFGLMTSLSFAKDEVPLEVNGVANPLLTQAHRACTIEWGADSAPFLAESDGHIIFPQGVGLLPEIVDRAHPTVGGEWITDPDDGQIWKPAHVYNNDASKVSAGVIDGVSQGCPDPSYVYNSIAERDPYQLVSQMWPDGVTPLVASREIKIGAFGKELPFYLCQPAIQMTIKTFSVERGMKGTNVATVDLSADREGRHMAFLYPVLDPPQLVAAPAFLVYGDWRMNTRERTK